MFYHLLVILLAFHSDMCVCVRSCLTFLPLTKHTGSADRQSDPVCGQIHANI